VPRKNGEGVEQDPFCLNRFAIKPERLNAYDPQRTFGAKEQDDRTRHFVC
jgi:hypothetical protein